MKKKPAWEYEKIGPMLQGQKGKTTDQQTLRRSEGMRLVIEKLIKMAFLAFTKVIYRMFKGTV